MRTFHHYMLSAALIASALSFRLASACLSWAGYHKRRYNLLEDERITAIMGLNPAPVVHRSIISKNKWIDAEPDECPVCGSYETCLECRVSHVPYPEK